MKKRSALRFLVQLGCAGIILLAGVRVVASDKTSPGLTPPSVPPQLDAQYRALEVLAKSLFYIENAYVDPQKVQIDDLVHNAINGVLQTLDPHSVLISADEFKQLGAKTKGSFGGVGVILSNETGKLVIISVIEDTPASRAGLQEGDEITAINGETLTPSSMADFSEKMQGPPGSTLKLSVNRGGEAREFSLKREIIVIKSFQASELDSQIFYGKIANFQSNTSSELEAYLADHSERIKGFILDLRDNPGGLLDQAVKVADLFIDKGVIVSTIGRDQERVEREFSQSNVSYTGFPMIVLINAGSASASEIVAGALQDHKRALILGTTSFGKGSVQTLIALPDGSGLKLTVARYYTPNNRSIQAKGITPDIIVSREQLVESQSGRKMREEDLRGHILSRELAIDKIDEGIHLARKKWPTHLQNDQQLFHAFTYLKGWSVFKFEQKTPTTKN